MPGPWEKYQQSGGGLPQAGDASPLTNPMAGMDTIPAYQSDDDWQAIAADVALNDGKGLSSIINQSPGHMQRKAYAEGIGKAQAGLAERQRAGMNVLSSLQQLRNTADEPGDEQLNSAIGPYNDDKNGWVDLLKLKAGLPKIIGGDPAPYDLNNRLHHDIEGLTTSFITSASKGGLNMSDARQKAFADTMGAMMKATNPEEFRKIAGDAENIVRDSFGIPRDAPLAGYTTQGNMPAPKQAAPTPKAVSRKEYDSLAPGTPYRAPDGKVRIKK